MAEETVRRSPGIEDLMAFWVYTMYNRLSEKKTQTYFRSLRFKSRDNSKQTVSLISPPFQGNFEVV